MKDDEGIVSDWSIGDGGMGNVLGLPENNSFSVIEFVGINYLDRNPVEES